MSRFLKTTCSFVVCLLLMSSMAVAALTDVYVNAAGSGGATGVDEGNAISWTTMVSQINGGGKGGTRYNVKGAVSRGASSDTISGSGSVTAGPVIIRGYGTTAGDGYQGRTSNVKDLITTNMPLLSYTSTSFLTISGSYIIVESMQMGSARSGVSVNMSGVGNTLRACVLLNSSTNAAAGGVDAAAGNTLLNCDGFLSGASGGGACLTVGGGSRAIGCHTKPTGGSTTTIGVLVTSSAAVLDCLITGGGYGIWVNTTSAQPNVHGCTITGCATSGIHIIASYVQVMSIDNCLITDCGTQGINCTTAVESLVISNSFLRNNGSGGSVHYTNGGDWVTATSYNTTTSSSGTSDYTNAAGGDYTLVSGSPAAGAGLPYLRSIGCFQRAAAAAGVRMFPIAS